MNLCNGLLVKVILPPELVTENKVALFLEEQVLYRQNHKSRDGNKKIGKSTINQYISALTSLWKYQVANNVNNHPTPRGVLVQSIQKGLMQRHLRSPKKHTLIEDGCINT